MQAQQDLYEILLYLSNEGVSSQNFYKTFAYKQPLTEVIKLLGLESSPKELVDAWNEVSGNF